MPPRTKNDSPEKRQSIHEILRALLKKRQFDALIELVLELLLAVEGLPTPRTERIQSLLHKWHVRRSDTNPQGRAKHGLDKHVQDLYGRAHSSGTEQLPSSRENEPRPPRGYQPDHAKPYDLESQTEVNRLQQVWRSSEGCVTVHRIIGQIGDTQQIEALELLSLAGKLDKHEIGLALALEPAEALQLWEWLCAQEVVRLCKTRLTITHRVRRAFVTYLRLHEPAQARKHVACLLSIIRSGLVPGGTARLRALGQLCTLLAHAPEHNENTHQDATEHVRIMQASHNEIDHVLATIEKLDGPVSRAMAARLAAYDPTSIAVFSRASGKTGVLMHLEIRGRKLPRQLRVSEFLLLADTVQPFVSSRRVRVTLVFVPPDHRQHVSCALGVLCHVMTRQPTTFVSVVFVEQAYLGTWRRSLDLLRYAVREDAVVQLGGRRLVPCVGDWADVGEVLFDVVHRAWSLPGATKDTEAVKSTKSGRAQGIRQDELVSLVRRALRNWGDSFWLEQSELALLMFPDVAVGQRGPQLREWLKEAIEATPCMDDGDAIKKALSARFLTKHQNRQAWWTMEDAMKEAVMSKATLNRKCRRGIFRIAENARQRIA